MGETLLFKNIDVAMWLDCRKHHKQQTPREMGDFVVVDDSLLNEFCEFRSSHTTQGIADLKLTPLLEYYMTRVARIPLSSVVQRFGQSYLPMDMDCIDELIEWVDEMRRKVGQYGSKAAFEL